MNCFDWTASSDSIRNTVKVKSEMENYVINLVQQEFGCTKDDALKYWPAYKRKKGIVL